MKICVQDGGLYSVHKYKDAYELMAKAGFEAIDWNVDVELRGADINAGTYIGKTAFEKSVDEILAYYAEELEAIRNAGLTISQAHAPFPFYSPNFVREDTCDFLIEVYKKLILMLDRVGCKNLIIHGVTRSKNDTKNTYADIRARNEKLYTSLIPTLVQTNVTVCLENLFTSKPDLTLGHCSNPYEAVAEIDALNEKAGKECFGICVDTGHLNLLGLDPMYYIPILGKRVKALHIHDNDGIKDLHKIPYSGSVNWINFYTALREIGYEGDLSFETFNQTDPKVIEKELLLPFFTIIAEIGKFFRKKITE